MAFIHDRPEDIPQEDSQRDALEREVSDEQMEEALDALYGDYLPDEHLLREDWED